MSFLPVIESFNQNNISYVVVGGLAVVLHGHSRLTVDVDFVVRLDEENASKVIETLVNLDFHPRAPVDPVGFSKENIRKTWVKEKGLTVFSFVNKSNPMLAVDLFVDYPIEYGGLYARSEMKDLGKISVRVCSIKDLIGMKKQAARPQDLEDARILEIIQNEKS